MKKNKFAVEMGKHRWEGKSKKEQTDHTKMMVHKRWANYYEKKIKEVEGIKTPELKKDIKKPIIFVSK